MSELIGASELQSLAGHAVLETARGSTAHPDEVREVDALEAIDDDRLDAEGRVPLAAKSRDEPVPYSLPATMTERNASFW